MSWGERNSCALTKSQPHFFSVDLERMPASSTYTRVRTRVDKSVPLSLANLAPHFGSIFVVSLYHCRSIISRRLSNFHPRVPQDTLAILRSSRDHVFHSCLSNFMKRRDPADVQEKHFPSPARNSSRITFEKEEEEEKRREKRHVRGF